MGPSQETVARDCTRDFLPDPVELIFGTTQPPDPAPALPTSSRLAAPVDLSLRRAFAVGLTSVPYFRHVCCAKLAPIDNSVGGVMSPKPWTSSKSPPTVRLDVKPRRRCSLRCNSRQIARGARVCAAATTLFAPPAPLIAQSAYGPNTATASISATKRQASTTCQILYGVQKEETPLRSPVSLFAMSKVKPCLQIRCRLRFGESIGRLRT